MKRTLRVHYDEEGDFLEIASGDPSPCYAEEIKPGVFIRKDEKTNEIKSIGILSFKKRTASRKDVDVDLPLDIQLTAVRSA